MRVPQGFPPAREMAPSVPSLEGMAGVGLETGGRVWDPLGFSTFSDESLTWRAAASATSREALETA